MTERRQIFGLSNSDCIIGKNYDPAYMKYLLRLSEKPHPTICYIGAAKGQNLERTLKFHQMSIEFEFNPKVLNFFNMPAQNLESYFNEIDILYVDGGVTRNLLALFREWHVDDVIRTSYQSGMVLSGASAGINILFEWCITDSVKSHIQPYPALGILRGSICPHYDSHPKRPEVFQKFLTNSKARFPAYGLEDQVGLHFMDESLVHVVSARRDACLIEYFPGGDSISHPADVFLQTMSNPLSSTG